MTTPKPTCPSPSNNGIPQGAQRVVGPATYELLWFPTPFPSVVVAPLGCVQRATVGGMTRGVPFTGAEKESLRVSLDRHRDVVLWKLEGLDDEQVRRALTPSGTNLLGLVKHLASMEYGWFCVTFGRETEQLPFDENDPDANLKVTADETTAGIVAYYGRARTAADKVIDEVELDELGTAWSGDVVSLRWALIRVIEETVRHAGHMDILRELIDGATGDHPRGR